MTISIHKASASAKAAVEKAGGVIDFIAIKPPTRLVKIPKSKKKA